MSCSYCGREPSLGHDPCIENLPGVYFACCGHGGGGGFEGHEDWSVPYLTEKGSTLYGHAALDRMRELGGDPPDLDEALLISRAGDDIKAWLSMTVIVSGCCGADIRFDELREVPPPPGALLATIDPVPEKWMGWRWVCTGCGEQVGITLDYGKVDLGIVRDSQLTDRPLMDVEIFDA